MKILLLSVALLVLAGCDREVEREVYSCEGAWHEVILLEDGRATVMTAAGVREGTFVQRADVISFVMPGRAPVDLLIEGDELVGEVVRCERVLAE